ncbi:MAG: UDP-N-acetylmuramoyl-L-alanine--D-glutamate ligase [Oscillospiraceae bacterium]
MASFFKGLKNKKVAFIGAGVSHRELVPMFAQAGAVVTLCDKRAQEEMGEYATEMQGMGVRLCLGADYLQGLTGQDMILRTPGFAYGHPALQQALREGVTVTSEMELFFENCRCRTLGITGSDGKTTTTSLCAAMLQQAGYTVHLGGNIGRAMLPLVDEIGKDDIAVVELSSFQLESMQSSPNIAVVTNLSPNHLDVHGTFEAYVDAKRNILLHQKAGDVAVLGWESEPVHTLKADLQGEERHFSRLNPVQNGAFLNKEKMLCLAAGDTIEPVVDAAELKLRGVHNIENMLAAMAAVRGLVDAKDMAQVARTFTGVEHRLEPVRMLNGVEYINDSIATTPTRSIAGLRSFGKKIILLAGGYDKKIPFEPMVQDILERVKELILMGTTADKIEKAVTSAPGYRPGYPTIVRAQNLEDAVYKAAKDASVGDIVLLSPACASFDAYANFEIRGRHFKQLVNAL